MHKLMPFFAIIYDVLVSEILFYHTNLKLKRSAQKTDVSDTSHFLKFENPSHLHNKRIKRAL